MEKRKLNKFELLEGINILFDVGYLDTKKLANINDCIYTKDDLKAVIDIKHKEWHDSPSMAKFVRIETLFNQTKFQKYIDEVESSTIAPKQIDNFTSI